MAEGILHYTAVTGTLKYNGKEVGEMQNISVNENYNVRQVSAIGHGIDIHHVPGVFRADLRAERVFLIGDTLFDFLGTLDRAIFPTKTFTSDMTQPLSDTDISQYFTSQANKAILDNSSKILSIRFDVELFNPDGTLVMKYGDCTINTRSFTQNIGTIINMSNVAMMCRKKYMGTYGGIAELPKYDA